jgi:dTDP-4-amino-4,6-dideoxygalactose transaminase
LTEMQSAIGRVLLRKLPQMVEKRRRLAAILNTGFAEIPALRITIPPAETYHSYYKFYVFLRTERLRDGWDRQRVVGAINAEGIPCFVGSCSEIYLEKAFPKDWQPRRRLMAAQSLGESSLMFLVHPTLSEADMCDTIRAVQRVLAVAAV